MQYLPAEVVAPPLLQAAFVALLEQLPAVQVAGGEARVALFAGSRWPALLEAWLAEREEAPRPELLLIAPHGAADLTPALRRGVKVLVGDGDDLELLAQALAAAGNGQAFCSPSVLPAVLSGPTQADARGMSLTHSELAVARRAVQGLRNQAIAALLQVSICTVKFHLHQTYGKLGIAHRGELRAALLARGIALEPAD